MSKRIRLDWTRHVAGNIFTPSGPNSRQIGARFARTIMNLVFFALAAVLTGSVTGQEPPRVRVEVAERSQPCGRPPAGARRSGAPATGP